MKGAIGNAFILNMVITFILIFFSLLIGSMAFSKANKVKNYLLNSVVIFDQEKRDEFDNIRNHLNGHLDLGDMNLLKLRGFFLNGDWDDKVNDYLGQIGYIINTTDKKCPVYSSSSLDSAPLNEFVLIRDTGVGKYDYCIYVNVVSNGSDYFKMKYMYKVLSFMRFDIPVVGQYIRLPLTGESKTITVFK